MKIGDRYDATRDAHGWILTEQVPARTREGEPTTKARTSYHASMEQCLDEIIDREAGRCPRANDLRQTMAQVKGWVRGMLSQHHHLSASEHHAGEIAVSEGDGTAQGAGEA